MAIDLSKAIYVQKTDTYVTCQGIISFAAIAKKWKDKAKPDDDGQFALSLIVPPDSDISVLKEAAMTAAKEKLGAKVKGAKSPFLDAAEKLDADRMPEGFDPTGWTMIRANTYQQRPNVMFANGTPVPEDEILDEVYNGRWARMSIRPHAFDRDGNKGVKFYLQNIQLLEEGEKWPSTGGRSRAEDEFEAINDAASGKAKASGKATKGGVFDDDEIPF
jgi:hypothetical protein